MNEDLKSSTVRGIKWFSLSQFSRQILQYISTVILVGILSPSDFGLMAMAVIVIGFLDIFKDLGTGSALIQTENPSNKLMSSIFWVNCSFGIIITLFLYFSATFFADVYSNEKIIPILQVLSLTFFLSGVSIAHKSLLEKSLSFHLLSLIELISSAISFIIGISCAVMGFGVWSLVFQSLTYSLLSTVLILIFSEWKTSFHFNFNEVKSISRYSINLVGFNIVNYFSRNADYFLIGKFLGDHPLGHYYLAYRIMLYPLQNITSVVSRVIYPSFTRIKNDNNRFRNAYLKITNSIAIISFPMMAGMALLSYDLVEVFFGANWNIELVSMLIIILAPVGAIQSVIATVGNIYQAKGRTDWMFKWSIFASGLTILGFFIGLRWGTIGVAVSYLLSNLILIYPAFAVPFNLIELNPFLFFRSFTKTLITVTLMLALLFLISLLISEMNSIFRLLVLLVSGITIYLVTSLRINKEHIYDLKILLPSFVGKRNGLPN